MSTVTPCPADKVIPRAAKLRANGYTWPDICQKLGHSEAAIDNIVEQDLRTWRKALRRAREEIMDEVMHKLILKLMLHLQNPDPTAQLKAADRLIKIQAALAKKRARVIQKPAKPNAIPLPAAVPVKPIPPIPPTKPDPALDHEQKMEAMKKICDDSAKKEIPPVKVTPVAVEPTSENGRKELSASNVERERKETLEQIKILNRLSGRAS